jgi:hypothetical protein
VKCRYTEFRKRGAQSSMENGRIWRGLKLKSSSTQCEQNAHADEAIVDIQQWISMSPSIPTSPFRYFASLEETILWKGRSRLLEKLQFCELCSSVPTLLFPSLVVGLHESVLQSGPK